MTTFSSSSKSNRLLQGTRYTIAQFDGQEAYTSVLDVNASEIYTQQNALPTSNLPYSGSTQDGLFIQSASADIGRYFYRLQLSPGNVANSGRYQTWFAVSGSDGSSVDPQLVQDDQLTQWISNKYIQAADAAKQAEASTGQAGYKIVLSKGNSPAAAEVESQNIYQFDYKTGVIQFTSLAAAPFTSEKLYLTGYTYLGQTLNQFIASGSGGAGVGGIFTETGSFFATTNDLQITGSLVATAAITGNEGFSASAGKDFSVDNGSGTKIAVLQGDASNNGELILDDATGDQKVRLNEGGTGIISGSSLNVSGNITSSGNISASGNINTNQLISPTINIPVTGGGTARINTLANADLNISTGIKVLNNITASGNISASGNITGKTLTSPNATFESASIDHLTVNVLISGSTIVTSGSNTFGDGMEDVQTLIGTTKITGSAQVTGSLNVDGVFTLPGITDVSASIAAAAASTGSAPDGSGIFNELGSTNIFAATSSLQISGSTLQSSPVTSVDVLQSDAGTGGTAQKYAMVVSQSVWHYSDNVGVPTSNKWQNSLDGSFFNNFDQNTDTAEILRFIAGLLSSSAPSSAPNTNTLTNITENIGSGGASSVPSGLLPQSTTNNTLAYLETKGFATDGQVLFNGLGATKGDSGYNIKYSSVSSGNTSISSSNSFSNGSGNTKLIGLGALSNIFTVSGSVNFRFSDNSSNTQTAISSSEQSLTNTTANSTSNGLTRATILTANPAVIPNEFQDGVFTDIFQSAIKNSSNNNINGINIDAKEATGFYEITSSIKFLTGSGAVFSTPLEASEKILYNPISNSEIPTNTPAILNTFSASISAPTSRSLSGAPYLQTANWQISSSVGSLFNPLYAASNTISRLASNDAKVGLSAATNHAVTVSTNGGTIQTSNAVFASDATTLRSTGTIPFETDIVKLSGSLAFTVSGNSTNIQKAGLGTTTFTVDTRGRNRSSSETLDTATIFAYHDAGTFGQPTDSGSLAYYGAAQGNDDGSLTGTTEQFTGEDFRIKINNNLLVGTFAAGDKFTTSTPEYYNLAKYDLQVKPGFLVYPGGTNKYWLANPDTSTDYKYYARAFQTDGGVKTSLTLNVGQSLVAWDSATAGVAVSVMFQAAATGINTGGGARVRPIIYDFATLSGTGNIATNQSQNDQLNPFTTAIDIGKNNEAGSGLNANTYTMPLTAVKNQVLNGTYTNYIILVRYKGAQTNPLNSSTFRINVGY